MNQPNITRNRLSLAVLTTCFIIAAAAFADSRTNNELLTGAAAMRGWRTDSPGVRRRLTVADLPAPYVTKSVRNHPREIPQPAGALPQVPAGFRVEKFADKLTNPRMIRTAPNGDLFVAESAADRIRVLRDADGDGRADVSEVFA